MIVFWLLAVLWSVISTMVVLSASITFARMSRLEEEPETIKHRTYVLQSTEEWPAAANPGVYDHLLS